MRNSIPRFMRKSLKKNYKIYQGITPDKLEIYDAEGRMVVWNKRDLWALVKDLFKKFLRWELIEKR